jgi:cellulose synthase operon protein C
MPDVKLRPLRPLLLPLLLAATLAAQAANDPKAARFYEDALGRYEKKDLKGAIIQLKNALQIDKDMLPVQLLLGRVLLADGQPGQAEVAFTEALRLGVSRAEVVVDLAQSLVDQGKQELLVTDPRFVTTGLPPGVQLKLVLQKASAAADIGNVREAYRLIEQARALNPADPDTFLAEVALRIRERRFDLATIAADKALALKPGAAGSLYQRAQIDHVSGQLPQALAGYAKALAADPTHVESLAARGGLLIDLNKPDEARRDVEALRKAARTDPRGAFLLALLAERVNDRAAARTALKEVTALVDPIPLDYIKYKPQVLMLNGLAHYGLGERENAKPYLEAYRKLDPGGGVSKLLAQILLAEGNIEPAIESLEGYLRAHPLDHQAQALLASAHMAQGRPARATSIAREAIKRSDTPELRTVLGLSMLRSGQATDAQQELEAAFKRDPNQLKAAATLVGLYIQRGQNAKALALADSLVKRSPTSATYHVLLGQARQATGDVKGARAAFEAAVRQDAEHRGAQVHLARLDVADKAFDSAERRLTALLAKAERDVELQVELAGVFDRRGRPDEAQRWLEKAVDHSVMREYRAGLALVDLHMRQNRAAKALEVAKSIAAKSPAELPPQVALARAQLANGDREGAKATLNTATRLANFDAPLQLEIGMLQLAAGNYPGATYSLEKSLQGQPDFLPAMAVMVDVDIRSGNLAQAEARARQIAQAQPQRGIGHLLLADVTWAKGQRPAAIEQYRKALKTEPSTDTMLRLHAAVLRHEGPKAALAVVQPWSRAHPEDRRARKELADAQARAGDFNAAQVIYEDMLKSRPNDPLLLNDLANVLLRQDPKAAQPVAEKALAAAPSNPLVIDTAGWVSFHNGQSDRALQLLRDARLRRPGEPVIRYHLAAVLAKTGRTAEAKAELHAALAAAPQFEGSEEAKRLLQSLP